MQRIVITSVTLTYCVIDILPSSRKVENPPVFDFVIFVLTEGEECQGRAIFSTYG